jgi:hypothetical protein
VVDQHFLANNAGFERRSSVPKAATRNLSRTPAARDRQLRSKPVSWLRSKLGWQVRPLHKSNITIMERKQPLAQADACPSDWSERVRSGDINDLKTLVAGYWFAEQQAASKL